MTEKTFEEVTDEVIKWLCENCSPHTVIIITPVGAERLSAEEYYPNDSHLVD